MSTRTRFEKEAKGNSEMAYYTEPMTESPLFADIDAFWNS